MKYITLLLAMVVILTSCRQDYDQRLLAIDAVMEEKPDSAYSALKEIDRAGLSDYDLPYYALLYTQAQVKNGVIVTSDSLFHYAYDHYSHQSSDDLKKRAHFYNAEIAFNGNKYHNAMQDVLTSYEIAKDEEDCYWIAKSAEMISDIMFDTFNFEASVPYELEAIEQYANSCMLLNQRYAICDLATTYVHLNKFKEALNLLDSLKNIIETEQPVDSNLLRYLNRTMPFALYYNNKFDELAQFLEETEMPESAIDKISLSFAKANFLMDNKDLDSASKIISYAEKIAEDDRQRIIVLNAAYQNAYKRKDYENASILADSVMKMQNRLISYVLKESVMNAQRDHYMSKSELLQKETSYKTNIIISIILASTIIILILIVIYRLKIKSHLAEIEENTLQIISLRDEALKKTAENETLSEKLNRDNENSESLKRQLEDIVNKNSQYHEVIESLFKEKWVTLNMLCNQYFDLIESDKTKNLLLNNIDKELKKLRSPQNIKEIEKSVDRYMGNIMTMMRSELSLKEDDYYYLALNYAGFSVRAICLFLNIKYKQYYLKKSRLRKRIISSESPHKMLFLQRLS